MEGREGPSDGVESDEGGWFGKRGRKLSWEEKGEKSTFGMRERDRAEGRQYDASESAKEKRKSSTHQPTFQRPRSSRDRASLPPLLLSPTPSPTTHRQPTGTPSKRHPTYPQHPTLLPLHLQREVDSSERRRTTLSLSRDRRAREGGACCCRL